MIGSTDRVWELWCRIKVENAGFRIRVSIQEWLIRVYGSVGDLITSARRTDVMKKRRLEASWNWIKVL